MAVSSSPPAAAPSWAPAELHAPLYGRRAGRLTSYQHAHSNFLFGGNPERGGGVATPSGVPPIEAAGRNGGTGAKSAWKPPLPDPPSEGAAAGAAGGGEQARVAKHGRRAPRALEGALPLQGGGGGGRLRMASNYAMGGRGAASCLVW